MTSSSSIKPMNWADYEQGRLPRQGSAASLGSRIHFDKSASGATSDRLDVSHSNDRTDDAENRLRKRRSSISLRINSFTQAGGVNSIENFARSWQRAAGFVEIPPQRPAFVVNENEEDIIGPRRSDVDNIPKTHRSLLRNQLEQEEPNSESTLDEAENQNSGSGSQAGSKSRSFRQDDIISHAPYLASPFASNVGGGLYGSLSSRANESSMRHAGRLFQEQQARGAQEPDKEQQPLLVKRVERGDGKLVDVVVGQSTLPQTIFNSVNVLVGVGLLSLPLGFRYSGWLVGLVFLVFAAITTKYTAGILAKCLDIDDSLITFADLAYVSFGARARIAISFIFSIELIGACVALVVLFADSLDALIPGWGNTEWKVFCGLIMVPLGFVPLRFLSFTSVLGIISCFGIVILVFVDGILKEHTPGSLREPAKTYLLPHHWSTLPLSFGLLMSPWGGHGVFPNIYRDMRHPYKYPKALNVTYTFTYLLDLSMAIAGLLMFGEGVFDEITSNIFCTKGYPPALSICIVIFIAIIPLTKIPLKYSARPIIVTIETICGLDVRRMSSSSTIAGLPGYARGLLKCVIRIATSTVITLIAILVPSFDTIMALMGSALAFSICIIFPVAFHLKLFGSHISRAERVLDWGLILACSIMAIVGTVWVFLPKEMVGAD